MAIIEVYGKVNENGDLELEKPHSLPVSRKVLVAIINLDSALSQAYSDSTIPTQPDKSGMYNWRGIKVPLPPHWWFAFPQALHELEKLTWHFDIVTEERDHGFPFLDVPEPELLVDVINGFLSEKGILGGGVIHNLLETRDHLLTQVVPIYQQGQARASERWQSISFDERAKLTNINNADIRNEAAQTAPENASTSEKSWFVEGFCKKWVQEEMDYYRVLYQANTQDQ